MAISGAQVVDETRKFLGDRYVYGAQGPSEFDCSGLAQYVYKQLGANIPRTSSEQFAAGTPVDAAQAQPGDLVFFGGGLYDGTPNRPGHVGIYIGDGLMINAPHTGAVVRVDPIDGNVGFRRYDTSNNLVSAAGAAASGVTQGLLLGGGAATVGGVSPGGGLFDIPAEITAAFSAIDSFVSASYDGLKLFFQPSTYVRIGAGIAGSMFIVAGIVFLAREAKS